MVRNPLLTAGGRGWLSLAATLVVMLAGSSASGAIRYAPAGTASALLMVASQQQPVDPVIEEPLRRLFPPESDAFERAVPADCGTVGIVPLAGLMFGSAVLGVLGPRRGRPSRSG